MLGSGPTFLLFFPRLIIVFGRWVFARLAVAPFFLARNARLLPNFSFQLCTLADMIIVCAYSCRKRGEKWIVAMNKWQDMTDMEVNKGEPLAVS